MQAATYTTEFHPPHAAPAVEPLHSSTALPSDRDRNGKPRTDGQPEPLAVQSEPSINRVVVRLSLHVIHVAVGLTDLSKLLASALIGLLRLS